MFDIPVGFRPSHVGGCDGGGVLIAESDGATYAYRFQINIAKIVSRSDSIPYGCLGTLSWITSDE